MRKCRITHIILYLTASLYIAMQEKATHSNRQVTL